MQSSYYISEARVYKKHSMLSNTLRTFAIQGVVLVVALPLFAFSFTSMIPVALAGLLCISSCTLF